MPSMEFSANRRSFGAAAGVNGRSAANGNRAAGPKTWQCASQAPCGNLNEGRRGEGWNEGSGCKFWHCRDGLIRWYTDTHGRKRRLKANAGTFTHQANKIMAATAFSLLEQRVAKLRRYQDAWKLRPGISARRAAA